MNKIVLLGVSTSLALLLAGCGPDSYLSKRNVGAGLGGIAGGVVGSQIGSGTGNTVATIAGTLIGAGIGGAIGSSMDDVDRMKMAQTFNSTPNNQTVQWQSPKGNNYAVTPTNTYTSGGQQCRNFTTNATVNGRQERIQGTACRQPNGSWRIVS